jgi:hypothetical protein
MEKVVAAAVIEAMGPEPVARSTSRLLVRAQIAVSTAVQRYLRARAAARSRS